MSPGPDLRIGDAERDVTTRQLRECFAQGRLTIDEFNDRLGQALSATTQADDGKVDPVVCAPDSGGGGSRSRTHEDTTGSRHKGNYAPVTLTVIPRTTEDL